MDTQLENLPVIDWELAKRLAGNHIDLAKDMLSMLTRDLPSALDAINQLAAQQNLTELLRHIHKLHGAVSYCGAPRLKIILSRIEINLKKSTTDDLAELLKCLNTEVKELLREHHAG